MGLTNSAERSPQDPPKGHFGIRFTPEFLESLQYPPGQALSARYRHRLDADPALQKQKVTYESAPPLGRALLDAALLSHELTERHEKIIAQEHAHRASFDNTVETKSVAVMPASPPTQKLGGEAKNTTEPKGFGVGLGVGDGARVSASSSAPKNEVTFTPSASVHTSAHTPAHVPAQASAHMPAHTPAAALDKPQYESVGGHVGTSVSSQVWARKESVDKALDEGNELAERIKQTLSKLEQAHTHAHVQARREVPCTQERSALEECYRLKPHDAHHCAHLADTFATCALEARKAFGRASTAAKPAADTSAAK